MLLLRFDMSPSLGYLKSVAISQLHALKGLNRRFRREFRRFRRLSRNIRPPARFKQETHPAFASQRAGAPFTERPSQSAATRYLSAALVPPRRRRDMQR